MSFPSTNLVVSSLARSARAALALPAVLRVQSAVLASIALLARHPSRRNDVYNILWAVVFGFATLNILSLAARRFEANPRGMSFGGLRAALLVTVSLFLLGWELLGVFHIFPINLQR